MVAVVVVVATFVNAVFRMFSVMVEGEREMGRERDGGMECEAGR